MGNKMHPTSTETVTQHSREPDKPLTPRFKHCEAVCQEKQKRTMSLFRFVFIDVGRIASGSSGLGLTAVMKKRVTFGCTSAK